MGPDYAGVFLLGLEYLTPKGWTEDQIASLVYVGITRARYKLVIPCVNRTALIEKLERALSASSDLPANRRGAAWTARRSPPPCPGSS